MIETLNNSFMLNPQSETQHFAKNWQQQLADAFSSIDELCDYLHLEIKDLPVSLAATKNFPLRVPLSFAASIKKGDSNDPLLRQILPISDEMTLYPGFSDDPVGDLPAAIQAGVLHKYHGRTLFINTGSCAINCRYCFRRNFPYSDLQLNKTSENAGIEYIASQSDIAEVILSGGDPLTLSDARLKTLIQKLSSIEHLKRIRIHSRLPIVLPARITAELLNTLNECGKQIVIIVHCNHANEINSRVKTALSLLKQQGFSLFNQAVLLKGVNDHADILSQLSEKLFELGVMPYYLHLLDKASGTGHFEVTEATGVALIKQLQNGLPGYLIPKLVKEQAGQKSKLLINIS